MKKIKFLTIPVLAALLLTGCANNSSETANKAPSVTGVKDVQCVVNSTVDFLDGVAALDKEDGDITPKMQITVTPNVEVSEEGYAYFSEVGEYTVTYSVEDSEGRVAQKRAFVDVVDRETYKSFAMPEGFTAEAAGTAKIEKCGMVNGKFVLEAEGGEIAEDIKLTRTYTLSTDLQYTFRYTVNSQSEGKIKVLADGYACAECLVSKGENVEITFNHTAKKENKEEARDVRIDVCLGDLGDVNLTVLKVETEYPQEEGKTVDLTENFSFNNRVQPELDTQNGTNGLKGNAWAGSEGKTACLKIESTCNEVYLGRMFVDTGIPLKAGVTYSISFNVERDEENGFQIFIQHDKWLPDDSVIEKIYFNSDSEVGEISREITVPEGRAGSLWLCVRSGDALNEIRLSNLSVIEHLSAVGKDSFTIEDFTKTGDNCKLVSDRGNFTYTVESFSAIDNQNQVTSPSFFVAGSSSNYVLSFRAKASAPIEMVFAAPVAGGWNPTIVWEKVRLTEDEAIYTFFCNNKASDRAYALVWQFGSVSNQQFKNVTIEISDIKVSLKNHTLDG